MMRATSGAGLAWQDTDILLLVATALGGLIGITVAWFGASGSSDPAGQATWMSVGVAAFTTSATGNCLWLLRGRRAIGERRAGLISFEPDEADPPADPAGWPDESTATGSRTTQFEFVRAEGMNRVHVPDCPLLTGKSVVPAQLGDGEPCGVCQP